MGKGSLDEVIFVAGANNRSQVFESISTGDLISLLVIVSSLEPDQERIGENLARFRWLGAAPDGRHVINDGNYGQTNEQQDANRR